MTRSVRLYTAAQFEEVNTLVHIVADRSNLQPAERDRLTAFQADLQQTVREDRRRATGAARLPVSSEPTRVMTAEPAAATRHTATYPGRTDQVRHVRRAVASQLAGCAAAADAILVASELAANAILHSRSRARHFTVRTELHPDHVRIEAEDFGWPVAPQAARRPPARPGHSRGPHRPGRLGHRDHRRGGRIVWARLDLDAAGE